MALGFDGDLEFGADPVIGGDQHRILESGGLQIEQAAKAADFGVSAGPARRAHCGFDRFHQCIAGIDVDARLLV